MIQNYKTTIQLPTYLLLVYNNEIALISKSKIIKILNFIFVVLLNCNFMIFLGK